MHQDEQLKKSAAISKSYLLATIVLPLLVTIVSCFTNALDLIIPLAQGLLACIISIHKPRRFAAFVYRHSVHHCVCASMLGATLDPSWFGKSAAGSLNEEEAEAFLTFFIMKPDEFLAAARKHAPQGFIATVYDIYEKEIAQRKKLIKEGRS